MELQRIDLKCARSADIIPDLWQSILVMHARILFSTTDLIRMNVKKETFSSG